MALETEVAVLTDAVNGVTAAVQADTATRDAAVAAAVAAQNAAANAGPTAAAAALAALAPAVAGYIGTASAAADRASASASAAAVTGQTYATLAEGEAATATGADFKVYGPLPYAEIQFRRRTAGGSDLLTDVTSSTRVTEVADAAVGLPLLNDVYDGGDLTGDGRVMVGLRLDGTVDISDTYPMINGRYRYAETFDDGSVMWGINHDGLMVFTDTMPFISSEWALAELYDDGATIMRGIRFDGSSYPGSASGGGQVTAWASGGEITVLKDGRRIPLTFGTPPGTVNVSPTATASRATYLIDNGSTVTQYEEDLLCATSLSPSVTRLIHIIGFGQSNRDGVGSPKTHGAPVNPGRAVMHNAGDKVRGPLASDEADAPLNRDHIVSLVDAYEIASSESPSMGFVWGITQPGRLAATDGALISSHAMGGQPFSAIRKGGTRPNIWNNLLITQKRDRIIAAVNGLDYVPLVHVTHGEADRGAPASQYGNDMQTLWNDCLADFGVPTKIVMSQMGAFTAYGLTTSEVPLDQLSVALLFPEKFGCSGPQYTLQRNVDDGIHIIKQSRQGSYDARTADRMLKGLDARPLHATGLVKSSATVYRLPMYVPVGALTLDTTTVSDPGNYGIAWRQTGGTARTISSVAISGNDIVVTLSGDPGAFTAAHIGIALYGAVDAHAGPTTGARSCFRDEATDLDIDGVPMPNWACHQRITVPLS